MAYKNKYKPKNLKKFESTKDYIICRSLWERSFAKWCDKNYTVKRWAFEPFFIPYYDIVRKKERKYYPDFVIELNNGNSYLIEVKPKAQTKEPKKRNTKRYLIEKYTYITNSCKWNAAKKFCDKNNMIFSLFTEDDFSDLGIKIIKKPPGNIRKNKRKKFINKQRIHNGKRRK